VTLQMRFPVLIALAAALFASAASVASATPPTSLDVTAKRVDFFSNRFIVTADGGVKVRLSDGTVVSGQTFTMDLKLNRYLVAGDVHLDGPTIHDVGAAFAGYPDLDRSYFLPASGTPSRETFTGVDWAHPDSAREQPGDAYHFPDLTGERPYIIADGARIVPKTNVLFDLARVYTAGVYLPSPRYVVTFSANSHYFENAFAGARLDVGVPFNGSEHSLTALHVRNDEINGTYLAFDQHFVWDQNWLVLGIDPLTQEQRQYNLIGYRRWTPKFETRLFTQVSAAQAGIINRASNAAGFGQLQLSGGFRASNLTYTQNNYYQYLLGLPRGITDLNVPLIDYDPRWKEHPMDASLAFTGGQSPLTRGQTQLFVRPRFGLGLAHDVYGYGGYPNVQPGPPTLYYHYVGASFYTPPVNLPAGLSLTALYDRQKTFYSVPHQVDNGDLRFTVAGAREHQHLRYFVAYEIKTIDDYWGAQQLAAYPAGTAGCGPGGAPGDVCTTEFGSFSGQNAFRGLATSRGYTSSLIYTPTPFFEFNVRLARFYDTPAPVPGLYGQPPWQLVGDLRVRVSRQILLNLSRAYYFNFANERWTPQFGIQFSP
jgi:hypothetical protein